MRHIVYFLIPALFAGALAIGCAKNDSVLSDGSSLTAPAVSAAKDVPDFPADPGDFVAEIDNPYLGFERGRVFRYEGETDAGLETIVVEVTHNTKMILGVGTTVVHDQAYLDGELVEDTFDWYAQDIDGNVWYFGEDSKVIEGGVVVSTEGSWEAGVDGAMPGVVMLAEPVVGVKYQQEFADDVAEDMAKVLSLKKTIEVPYGSFDGCLMTAEWSHLEPGAREFKYYAPGVGLVLELSPAGGRGRSELVSIEDEVDTVGR
jgi:hypothetical protein